jgi:hypothetical protein
VVSELELKVLSKEAIPRSLERVERYRLLNQPALAESICFDILEVESDNQQALTGLILALTDQFDRHSGPGINRVLELLPRLTEAYDRDYYTGLVYERQAKARLLREYPGGHFDAYDLLYEALEWYEKADLLHEAGNEDARLHWNSCVRIIESNQLKPRPDDDVEPAFD